MIYYMDSSALLRLVLENPHAEGHPEWAKMRRRALDTQAFIHRLGNDADDLVSTELLKTEMARVLRREALPVSEADHALTLVEVLPNTLSDILDAAQLEVRFLTTLDAVHLAAAIRLQVDAIVTYDAPFIRGIDERNGLIRNGVMSGRPIQVVAPGER